MRKLLIFMVVLIPLFLGCEEGKVAQTSWELTVVDHGSVSPTYVESTTAITFAGRIHYTEELKSGGDEDALATLAEWSAYISDEELSSLNALIDDSNIIKQGDIIVDEDPCIGGQGMSVYFTSDSGENEFRILGVCQDDEAMPLELSELFSFVDELVEKYGF